MFLGNSHSLSSKYILSSFSVLGTLPHDGTTAEILFLKKSVVFHPQGSQGQQTTVGMGEVVTHEI